MDDPGTGPRAQAGRLPLGPGVYRFRDAGGRVLYLGRAVCLRRRAASYWGDLGDRPRLAPMVRRIARVEAVECDSALEAAWLERNLLRARTPPWNKVRSGGQESEVWISVSTRASRPGMAVVHQPAAGAPPGTVHFGPYLGGQQARLAVSGLGRVHPLGYCGDTPDGTLRDMARARGVSAAERATLAEAIEAVLSRDPCAVRSLRARLTERRDAASAALAFELAARLQAEIEAIDWVTAEQKVSRPGTGDFAVSGWVNGTLVRFEVRGGYLSRWSQRACGRAAASRHLAGTPAEWAAFAQRNAELAARLATLDG